MRHRDSESQPRIRSARLPLLNRPPAVEYGLSYMLIASNFGGLALHNFMRTSASIQPRTRLLKFGNIEQQCVICHLLPSLPRSARLLGSAEVSPASSGRAGTTSRTMRRRCAASQPQTARGPGGSVFPGPTLVKMRPVRSEVNSELNFSPNFEGLVLGCIDADFCK